MFASFRSKTFIILLIMMLVACSLVWAGPDFTTGNYIPMGNSSTNSAGAFIVSRTTAISLNASTGKSDSHYISTFVGDTSLRFSTSATKNNTKAYGKEMICAVITCHKDSTLTLSLTMSQKYGNAGYTYTSDPTYFMPYVMVIVKVSNFSSNHNTYSITYTDWLEDSNSSCTYTVVAILDSRDPGKQTASNLVLDEGECFHIVMVPFSNSNEVYWEGANLVYTGASGSAPYYARFDTAFSYSYKNSSGSTITGFATDAMETQATVTKAAQEYEALAFSSTPESSTLTLADMLENSNSTLNKSAEVYMSYAKFTDNVNATMTERTLHVKLRPYSNLEEYYFMRSGASSIQANRHFVSYLKIANISSYCSSEGVKLKYTQNGNLITTEVNSGTVYDTQTLGSTIEFELNTVIENIQGSTTYKKKNTASLSFDVFPYIESIPSVLGGDYSMIIVTEFSID